MDLRLGEELLAAPKAAAAALQDRTGVDCTLGPRPSPGRGVQLFIRPQAPVIEGTRSAGRPDTKLYRVAYDTILRLRGRGAIGGGDSFYAEAVQAHFKTNVALDTSFEVDPTAQVSDGALPEGAPAAGMELPPVIVDAEGEGAGDFFQESPQSGDYVYRKDWLLTLRFKRTITEEDRLRLFSEGGITLTVDVN